MISNFQKSLARERNSEKKMATNYKIISSEIMRVDVLISFSMVNTCSRAFGGEVPHGLIGWA